VTFKETLLGGLLTFQRGYDITKAQQTEGDVPIVSSSGVSSFHNESKADAPGVVIGRKGTLGTVHYLERPYWPHDTTLWIKDFKGSHPRFLSYFLSTLRLENFDTGASNPTLNRNHLHKIKVIAPAPAEQEKIAAVLAACDDLIANNQRRIALLESMAEEIYREWFVRMRFPGFESAKHEKGMPLGWQASTAAAMVHVLGGGTPSTEISQYWGGHIPFFSPKDSHDGVYCLSTEQYITELGLENCSSRLFPKDTIFITARGTVGNLVMAGEPMAMNQSCYALVSKVDKKPYFVFTGLKCAVNVIKGVSNSGVFDNVVMDTFKIIPLINPGDELRAKYIEVAEPIYEQALMLRKSNIQLRATRDALLPRLISGKLRVDHLDIQFPPSMIKSPEEAALVSAVSIQQ
jgi:type I restriction enzyme S subunit